jgi:hypothetical protein
MLLKGAGSIRLGWKMVAPERRNIPRKRLKLHVQWDMGELTPKGFTTDISPHGMGIRTHQVVLPGNELFFLVRVRGELHPVRGVVRWARETSPSMARYVPGGMGIAFTRKSAEVQRLFHNLDQESE